MDELPADKSAPERGQRHENDQFGKTIEPQNHAGDGSPQPAAASNIQHIVDKTLQFLSHASNETLGACLVGLGATTYFVLGRVGLVIIGVAGGVVLQATWDGVRQDHGGERDWERQRERRRETGLQIARRLLDLQSDRPDNQGLKDAMVYLDNKQDFSEFEPETRSALETFTNAVIKDYVYYWYGPTLPGEESFPVSCKRTLTAYLLSLSGHLRRKRPADVFLDFVTNASSIIIVFLNELAAATNASPQSSSEEAIATYLKLKPESSLSYVLDEQSQSRKLADISEDILHAYLDSRSYNCPPVHIFLKEILAQLVLGYTVTMCSKPEWINEWIVYGLEESETASKVMDIVDAGVEGRDTVPILQVDNPTLTATPEVKSKKEAALDLQDHSVEHKRNISRAEEAMDDAMREAKRLTQLMIEEDEKRAQQEGDSSIPLSSSEDFSDAMVTYGARTPTSSDSDRERRQREVEDQLAGRQTMPDTQDDAASLSSVNAVSDTQAPPASELQAPYQSSTLSFGIDERTSAPLTLHNASISIFDDSQPGERTSIKAKPTTDYLIQIEPTNSMYSGWMISRKYGDFEMLHEVLRRISVITGVTGFTEAHATMPLWKSNTKSNLRTDLEKYLIDAAKFQPLAESEGMKRFLEKDRGLSKSPSAKGFGWPTPDAFGKLGGDMMNALTKAPKQVAGGVAGGGKAVYGGVAGLVGAGKKPVQHQTSSSVISPEASISGMESGSPTASSSTSEVHITSPGAARGSQDSFVANGGLRPTFTRQLSADTTASSEMKPRPPSSRSSIDIRQPLHPLQETTTASASVLSPSKEDLPTPIEEEVINLPPPPSEMPADYSSPKKSLRTSVDFVRSTATGDGETPPATPPRPIRPKAKPKTPLSERETSVAVELMFAVVSELYTLSSAWNFRRTLLTAAKSFLLRPGNPQLAAIKDLLQNSLLDANLSDAGLAAHILKLRENALPTEEELEAWKRDYPEKTPEQKEELRIKARKLLVTKGMPQALTSVMGAAASGEALGKVFDCLQVESVSRGLIFGLMLQALKVVTH